MKRIAIATFINDLNYGALLQAFSLGKYLNTLGYECKYVMPAIESKTIESVPNRFVKKVFYYLVAKRRITMKRESLNVFLKTNNFEILTEESFKNSLKDFDALICGSDQIWNIDITGGFSPLFFSQYDIFSIAYSASVGDLSVVINNKESYLCHLLNFNYISTRENNLSTFIKDELGLASIHTCDPVFLMKDYFVEKCTNNKKKKKPYIFVYTMNKNKNIVEFAKRLSKKKGLPIVCLNNNLYSYSLDFYNTKYALTIDDFLSLIKNASYVVTNSFHGTAFSIIFEKEFFTLKSASRNDRIEEMLAKFNLSDRLVLHNDCFAFTPIDYKTKNDLIIKFVDESKEYLKQSLLSI